MSVSFYVIAGLMLGAEWVRGDEDSGPTLIVDLALVRVMFQF